MSERKVFTDFEFVPADGLRNKTYSPTEPESEEAIRDQIQGIPDQLRDHINLLQQQLSCITPGNSGAEYIGAAPTADIHGNTVAQQIENLKQQIDETAMGVVPDGSVTASKLANNSVVTGHISSKAVTAAKLADNAVTTGKILDGSITSDKLADGCITSEKVSEIAGMTRQIFITEDGSWTVPSDNVYRFTLYGGGGGGGSGFFVYNTNISPGYHWFGGAGGSASVPVSRELYLKSGTVCSFVIGKGGKGRTTSSITLTSSSPISIEHTDAMEVEGGETCMYIDDDLILATSQRIPGGSYRDSTCSSAVSAPSVQFGGQPGASLAGTAVGGSQNATGGNFTSISATAGKLGGGDGASYTRLERGTESGNHGGNASLYGCGGGGGSSTYSSNVAVSRGGDGMDGVAIIQWTL